MKKTTEELALTTWGKWSTSLGKWTHEQLQTACLSYLSRQAKTQTSHLSDIANSLNNIRHYFHSLDADGFRGIIRMKATTMRRRYNKKITQAVPCGACGAKEGSACHSPSGYRKPHAKRVRAYEAGA